jgi:hypothetical protein
MNDISKKANQELVERNSTAIIEAISKEDRAKDIMPLATSVASWILEDLSIKGVIPYTQIKNICAAMYVSPNSIIMRIQANPDKNCKDSLRLEGSTESLKNPIKIPDEQTDADLNYMERISYIRSVYLHDRTVPFNDKFDDARASSYLLKVVEDASPEKNICLFSMALFYATEGYREELRPYAIMLLRRFTNAHAKRCAREFIKLLNH